MPPVDRHLEKTLQEHADTLAGMLSTELDSIKKLQAARTTRIDEGAKAAKEGAAAATSADHKLQYLLEFYQAQDEQRLHRRLFYLRYVLPSVLAALLGGGGVTTWLVATGEKKPTTEDIQQTIDERVKALERNDKQQQQRTERLGDLHFETLDVVIDGFDKHDKKLDAIGKRLRVEEQIANIDEPTTLQDARAAVKAYKRRKEHKEIEQSLKKGDPFADLEPLDPGVIEAPPVQPDEP